MAEIERTRVREQRSPMLTSYELALWQNRRFAEEMTQSKVSPEYKQAMERAGR